MTCPRCSVEKVLKGNHAMQINVVDIAWEDLQQRDIHQWLLSIRDDSVKLLRLRFSKLPWTSFLLCTPRNHVVGMHNKLIPWTHARWMMALLSPENIRKDFAQEHANHNLKPARIPLGFYAYGSGDKAEPESTRLGTESLPLPPLWFEPYIVPQTSECESIFLNRIQGLLDSLGWFFLRPMPDERANLDRFQATKVTQMLFDSPPPRPDFHETCAALAAAIESIENGEPLDRELLSCCMTYYGRCPFPFEMNDEIPALRARLIKLTGWPLFFDWAVRGLAQAKTEYPDRKPPSSVSYNVFDELEAYLETCWKQYPLLKDDPYLDEWKMRKMPTGKA